jgi:hypothetical protein
MENKTKRGLTAKWRVCNKSVLRVDKPEAAVNWHTRAFLAQVIVRDRDRVT